MSMDCIAELSHLLCERSLQELRSIPGLHERRADIVPMGSVILHASLQALGMPTIEARTTGLRYGAMITA
jgi:exopolyphosphatase/pppGpp-phosphohydrolase